MIRWMAEHKVAANLLMLILLFWGGMSTLNIKQELFPAFELDLLVVAVPYSGATPEEVEESIIVPIESALEGIEGIKKMTSTAREGAASIRIELDEGSNRKLIQDEVQSEIDRISIFPDEAETPRITAPRIRREVLNIVVYGDAPNRSLVEWAQLIKDELLKDDRITQVDVEQRRTFELKIEIPRSELQQYSMTMDHVAQIIRQSTIDMPGGKIQTSGGDLLVRTKERRYTASEYARIPLLKTGQGALLLGDIARISDGFEESVLRNRYNGKPSQRIAVYRVGDQTPTEVSQAVQKKLLEIENRLPISISTSILNDRSTVLQDRIDLLVKNLLYGLVLVFLTLALFLKIPLAFWIMMGIPISYAGAMIAMPGIDVSINMISLFAFILVLGIVVDDAIVVGENIYAHQEMNKSPVMAAVEGAREISTPVLITILTTVAAFIPFYFVPGTTGKFFRSIPNVLIIILFLSLVEAMFILPGHLAHRYRLIEWILRPLEWILDWPRTYLSKMLKWVSEEPYRKLLKLSIRYRYTTLAVGIFMMLLCAGLALGGHIRFTFFPSIDSDRINVRAELPFGTPVEVAEKVESQMLEHAETLLAKYEAENGKPVADGIYSTLGKGGSHKLNMRVYLKPLDERGFESKEFSRQWQRMLGQIPGLTNLSYRSRHRVASENDIDLQLSHPESQVLERVVGRFKEDLSQYPGVSDIEDTTDTGKKEVRLTLSDAGHAMGMNAQDLTRQVRGAFQGLEVFKIQREGNEVSVMLRIPEEE
ncbi:MAG: acriflavin resistance protein, partial [Deltaproteobacteria bacterium]|nr:acriflavin resistance protein [Deltaproteobacteria bacterium]